MSSHYKKPKGALSKIYRRKNEDIPKDFVCSLDQCLKAYGSYAALYTHMKKKHPEIKTPTMPTIQKTKIGQPGRPKTRRNDELGEAQRIERDETFCKICTKKDCDCVEDYTSQEKIKVIEIMGNEKFINLTNEIGSLSYDTFSWVRRTEEKYRFKKTQRVMDQVRMLNTKYNIACVLPKELAEWLSFSSRYWDEEYIDELYHTFYLILFFQNYQRTVEFIKGSSDFPNMKICMQRNPNEFKRLESLIRII